jgi:uncharacterized protein YqgC (DUF456 family)
VRAENHKPSILVVVVALLMAIFYSWLFIWGDHASRMTRIGTSGAFIGVVLGLFVYGLVKTSPSRREPW